MKLEPMKHQVEANERQIGKEFYALFGEQGTGKTYMLLDDIERLYRQQKIDAVLCVAPKGVHSNWVRREIPKLLEVEYEAVAYKPGVKYVERGFQKLLHTSRLAIFTINIEAAVSKKGYQMCLDFLRGKQNVYMIIDESHRIKNPQAARTKKLIALAPLAKYRRIATGTATPNAPPDLFSQFEFLAPRQGVLGTSSYRAFNAKYTKLLPKSSPLVQHIKSQTKKRIEPQIPQTDTDGNPIYRNLDEINRIIQPFSYRILKKDCLDLPEKIYKIRDFDLTPAQRRTYTIAKEELLLEIEGREDLDTMEAIEMSRKLVQITSGFVMVDGEAIRLPDNPRLETLAGAIEDTDDQFIIWGQHVEEMHMIAELLEKMDIDRCFYYGDVTDAAREEAVEGFQDGTFRAFVGHPAAGGVGLTLTAAESTFYFTNGFNWADREQSEDRNHRIGTTNHVTYTDFIANDTMDERILNALKAKTNMSKAIMGELIRG